MTPFDAHTMFALRPDQGHGLLHPDCDREIAPVLAAALAGLSGGLDDCQTNDELDDLVRHGLSLLSMEIVGQQELHDEIVAVLQAVEEWGLAAEARLVEDN